MSDFEMDVDDEIDEDTQTQMKELEQLRAVLQADEQDSTAYSDMANTESCPSITSGPIVNQMTDDLSKIEMAIALNKFTDEKLHQLEKMLMSRLLECKAKLRSIQASDIADPQERPSQFRYVSCGKPYFKDKSFFPAPPNDDTILMMKSEMYDFSSIPSIPGWTVKDKSDFIRQILKMSQNLQVKELNSQISRLRRHAKASSIGDDDIDDEVDELRKQIEAVNKKSLKDLALPVDQEYDWETIANKLNHRHSAHEYRSLWKLFLHPSINKSSWSKVEHNLLQKLAFSHKMQDWDQIAKELNTGRTGYQCFVYYRTNMNSDIGQKWSKEEEEYLKRLVDFYKEDNYIPWGRVAASMENRTKVQIYNKYMRLEEQRKGRFIPEEDAVILTAVDHFGIKNNFRKIQQYLPGRSVVQLRNRYQVLCKNRVSTVWSVKEDKKLVQLLANQDQNMSNYATVCEFFPGKDRAQLRARHKTLLKWMKRYPNLDLSFAPRRGSRRLGHGNAMKDLNNALENLKNRIQSEVKEKKSKVVTAHSSEQEIEDAIVATLVTEALKSDHYKHETIYEEEDEEEETEEVCPFPTSDSSNTTNIEKLLLLLRCKLNKEKFTQSADFKKYFGEDADKNCVPVVKVKCYSRNKESNSVRTIQLGNNPDLWGNNKLDTIEYVLPPHLATITGCKTIMSYVKDHADPTLNLYYQNNRKKYSAEFNALMDRFNLLFLWPVLLSNENPGDLAQMNAPQPYIFEPKVLPTIILCPQPSSTTSVFCRSAIPTPQTSNYSSNNIDLPDDEDDKTKENVTLQTNFNIEFNETY
ncbi:snRNA-activating protein complex subunit 4 [Amyelois transitella]|uniref:snRNA-activating protein complex subunit 4 n=1 Tax=Amyelois transitella TaxID=680683 RepID=UPI00298FB33E|nr:snRNA-activating protein complex subunit 4 [Amyelois transitella]